MDKASDLIVHKGMVIGMSGFMQSLKGFLIYKEPPDPEGFELLEDESEHNESDTQNSSNNSTSNKGKETTVKKASLTLEEWNNNRRNSTKVSQPSGDLVSDNIENNKQRIKEEFNIAKNSNIIVRNFKAARKIDACIVLVDGMVDRTVINNFILRQLMTPDYFDGLGDEPVMDYITDSVLSIDQVTKTKEYNKVIKNILDGLTALFIDGCDECLLIETRGYEKRLVDKPIIETVVQGSQEGFTENLKTNITLVRRIVRNKKLMTEIVPVGKTNNMSCAIMFVEGIANPKIISEVKRRVKNINRDFIDGTEMLGQLVVDDSSSIFPQILTTERPDRTASFLMDGMVVIIAEGTPSSAAVPVSVFHLFHSPEDYYLQWQFSTFIRFIRILGLITAFTLPGLYLALVLYHHEMIPTELLLAIKSSREKVPFPTIVEVLIMEFAFELIREAGIRVPGVIGNTLGIIGALILGQAAVSAGIVSPILIIIVSITGLGNFSIANYSFAFAIRIVRFVFIFLGALAGFFGISVGLIIVGGYACRLKSFGVPYLSPIAPKTKFGTGIFSRNPLHMQKERPDYNNTIDRKRSADEPREWMKNKKDGEDK